VKKLTNEWMNESIRETEEKTLCHCGSLRVQQFFSLQMTFN